jgi:hypothetical protein
VDSTLGGACTKTPSPGPGEGGCRDPETERLLGRRCPKLRRANGQWSPHHGTWSYQLELPPKADGKRRNPLRRSGFTSQDAAEQEITQVLQLLGITKVRQTQIKITDLITETIKNTKKLPDADTVRRKVRTGQQLNLWRSK